MSDQLTEALAWYDDGGLLDGPAGAAVEDHLAAFAKAARKLLDFPTAEMRTAAAKVLDQLIPEAAPSLIRERAAALVLEEVHRVMLEELEHDLSQQVTPSEDVTPTRVTKESDPWLRRYLP